MFIIAQNTEMPSRSACSPASVISSLAALSIATSFAFASTTFTTPTALPATTSTIATAPSLVPSRGSPLRLIPAIVVPAGICSWRFRRFRQEVHSRIRHRTIFGRLDESRKTEGSMRRRSLLLTEFFHLEASSFILIISSVRLCSTLGAELWIPPLSSLLFGSLGFPRAISSSRCLLGIEIHPSRSPFAICLLPHTVLFPHESTCLHLLRRCPILNELPHLTPKHLDGVGCQEQVTVPDIQRTLVRGMQQQLRPWI